MQALLECGEGDVLKVDPTCTGREFRDEVDVATLNFLDAAWIGSVVSRRSVKN